MHQPAGGKDACCVARFDRIRTRRLFRGSPGPQGHSVLEFDLAYVHDFPDVAGGENIWGPDQCKNDRDGTVDHDERLRITGIEPGRYDVKLADKVGRVCIVRNVEVKDGAVFSIDEKQLTDCRK